MSERICTRLTEIRDAVLTLEQQAPWLCIFWDHGGSSAPYAVQFDLGSEDGQTFDPALTGRLRLLMERAGQFVRAHEAAQPAERLLLFILESAERLEIPPDPAGGCDRNITNAAGVVANAVMLLLSDVEDSNVQDSNGSHQLRLLIAETRNGLNTFLAGERPLSNLSAVPALVSCLRVSGMTELAERLEMDNKALQDAILDTQYADEEQSELLQLKATGIGSIMEGYLATLLADSSASEDSESAAITTETKHSLDYSAVIWHGEEYTFTPNQAACVGIMWGEWDRGTRWLREQTILEYAGVHGNRLRDVFRTGKGQHSAWETMIQKKPDTRDMFGLCPAKIRS